MIVLLMWGLVAFQGVLLATDPGNVLIWFFAGITLMSAIFVTANEL